MRKGRYGLMRNLTQEYYTMFIEAGLLEPSSKFEALHSMRRSPRIPLPGCSGHRVVEIQFKGHRNKKGIVLETKYDGQVLKCAIPAEAPYEYEGVYLFNVNRWELVRK